MSGSILLGLLQNTAILLSFGLLYDNLWINRQEHPNLLIKIISGVLIGTIGIVLMLSPWTMIPGIVFDTRSVMLSVAGLFFGPIPTFVAMAIDITFRAIIGGEGVWMGMLVILFSGITGILWRYFRPNWIKGNRNLELLMLGITVHALMLASTIFLPGELKMGILKAIAVPIVLVYIPAELLLGRLLISQYENWKTRLAREELLESEQRLIRDLVIAKEKAEESDRLKSAFLANLSHEIHTPMNGILGFAEILQNPDFTDAEMKEYLGLMRTSGMRLLDIIHALIAVSKLETGQVNIRSSNVDVNELLDDIHNQFQSAVEAKGLRLIANKSLLGSESVITSDKEKINTVLSNLVKNAIRFSKEGVIEFGYIKKGRHLEFYVKDQGIGIPADRQAAIFDRFVQADISFSHANEGAGLGLAIAKAYVELLGGAINVTSEQGRGSTFFFTVPAWPAES